MATFATKSQQDGRFRDLALAFPTIIYLKAISPCSRGSRVVSEQSLSTMDACTRHWIDREILHPGH